MSFPDTYFANATIEKLENPNHVIISLGNHENTFDLDISVDIKWSEFCRKVDG